MDLVRLDAALAELNARLAPIANQPVDTSRAAWEERLP